MIEKELTLGEFPPVSYEQWRAAVDIELKGVPFEKNLVTHTLEGIDIQPLYTVNDWRTNGDPSGFPGFLPLTRGTRVLGRTGGWDIRQEHRHPNPVEANKAILEDLEHGVSSIELRLDAAARAGWDADAPEAVELCGRDGVMAYNVRDLDEVFRRVRLDLAPASMSAGPAFLPAAALMVALGRQRKLDPSKVQCAFNADPIGALMSDGELGIPLDTALRHMSDLAAWTARNYPKATSVKVDTGPYHDAGATSVQDLAFAIATAVEYLRAMTEAGLDIDTAARQIVFEISIGCQFFRAIAKLRALRKMWAHVVTECGGGEAAARSIHIHVRTSRRILTRYDPWVNLLRNTVCCFAAAVGGADSITTLPLDAAIGLSDEFSRHLARNTQIVLQEESHLNREIDPAGGSWFLERLTDQLAEKAWGLFQAIESRGGMRRAVTDGSVADQIRAVQATRDKHLATRKQVVTGVSEHPNQLEERLVRPKQDWNRLRQEASSRLVAWRRDHACGQALTALVKVVVDSPRELGALSEAAVQAAEAGATLRQIAIAIAAGNGAPGAHIERLELHRYAAAYEELRDASDQYKAKTGKRPLVFLANIGKTSDFIARSTYALNFFEAGGFQPVTNDGFKDAAEAAVAFAKSGANVAVICSSEKKYESVAEETARQLKACGARTVILAGNPGAKEPTYRAAGVDRFIFVRCNVLGTLQELLREEGVLS